VSHVADITLKAAQKKQSNGMKEKLTREQILELVDYNPDTGEFIWLSRTEKTEPRGRERNAFNNIYAGNPMGAVDKTSENRVAKLHGISHHAKTLAFVIMTGEYPDGRTTYRDGNKTNLRWSNLCTAEEARTERAERKAAADSSKTLTGVVWYDYRAAYRAFYHLAFVTITVGYYANAEAASEARSNKLMEIAT